MSKPKPTRYSVTLPDGSIATRNSHRVYTHAIAIRRGSTWRVAAFCGSADLAAKECETQQRLHARPAYAVWGGPADEYAILPTGTEP